MLPLVDQAVHVESRQQLLGYYPYSTNVGASHTSSPVSFNELRRDWDASKVSGGNTNETAAAEPDEG
jgi:hypothetical protein